MIKKDIKIEKIIDTKRWKVLDEMINKQQLIFKLGHLNPEVFMDLGKGERNKIIKTEVRGNITETTQPLELSQKKAKWLIFMMQ